MAAPAAATADPRSVMTRRGSLPASASSAATAAYHAHAYMANLRVCALEAKKIGITRYSTTTARTDHADCAIADAAGGAVVAVCVSHDCSGHSASLPPTPSMSSTEATTSDRTVQPGLVCRIG